MGAHRGSIAGLMTLVAVVAADYLVLQTIPSVSVLATRIGLFGACHGQHRRGLPGTRALEPSESGRDPPLRRHVPPGWWVGDPAACPHCNPGPSTPLPICRPHRLSASCLARLWARPSESIQALLVSVILTPLLLFPALLAGWATRGYRLKLMKSDGSLGDVKVPGALRRLRISITCLMVLVALIAVDIAVLRAAAPSGTPPRHIWLFGILPVENLLAVYLIVAVLSLRKRGDVALVRFVRICRWHGNLAPALRCHTGPISSTGTKTSRRAPEEALAVTKSTACRRSRRFPGGPPGIMMAIIRLILLLVSAAVVIFPVLLPALLAAWATRGRPLETREKR